MKLIFYCKECGNESPRWLGQCPVCKEWNTLVEAPKEKKVKNTGAVKNKVLELAKTSPINHIETEDDKRLTSGIAELDRVLGGGVVLGSVILIGGEPGIGKSTLLLGLGNGLASQGKDVLYISGEESLRQIKMRADRLKINSDSIYLLAETDFENIENNIVNSKADLVMVDSIQTIYDKDLKSSVGSISQIKAITSRLVHLAKSMNMIMVIVGHITKDGAIAGPKVLEHIVDTVLYFEGDKLAGYRIIKAVKNRYGPTNETGIFEMKNDGLVEVLNPSEYMLTGRPIGEAGSLVVCAMEGTRPLFVEVQALLTKMAFNMPVRTVNGVDYSRVMMILAVLQKKLKIDVQFQDCYINIAGGLKLSEPSLDLGIAVAIISGYLDRPIDSSTVVIGEIGLTGEIRAINHIEARLKEAVKLGFKNCIIPEANKSAINIKPAINISYIKNIKEIKRIAF